MKVGSFAVPIKSRDHLPHHKGIAVTDAQLIERLEALYGAKGALTQLAREAVTERVKIDEDIRRKLIERMGDVSAFMKELKQRFSRWYNRRHERFGTYGLRDKCLRNAGKGSARDARTGRDRSEHSRRSG